MGCGHRRWLLAACLLFCLASSPGRAVGKVAASAGADWNDRVIIILPGIQPTVPSIPKGNDCSFPLTKRNAPASYPVGFAQLVEDLGSSGFHSKYYFSYFVRTSCPNPDWYYPSDTHEPLAVAAYQLDNQLRSLVADDQRVTFDLIGHSLGGVVAAYWVVKYATPGMLSRVHSLITFDSPLHGISSPAAIEGFYGSGSVWFDLRPTSAPIVAINDPRAGVVAKLSLPAQQYTIATSPSGGYRNNNLVYTINNRQDQLITAGDSWLAGARANNSIGSCTDDLGHLCHVVVQSDPTALQWALSFVESQIRQAQTTVPIDPTRLKVVAQRTVPIAVTAEGQILSLSPSGTMFLVQTSTKICIYSSDTFKPEHCNPYAGFGPIQPESVAWSPDSTHVAFTENWADYFNFSHIWVLDAVKGTLVDITEDHVHRNTTHNKGRFDVAPAWSPDGRSLIFARTLATPALGRTVIYRISANGGVPTPLLTVPARPHLGDVLTMRWIQDMILFSVDAYDKTGAIDTTSSGIWRADSDGSHVRRIIGVSSDQEAGSPVLESVSADATTCLIFYTGAGYSLPGASFPVYELLDLKTGNVRRVDSIPNHIKRPNPFGATFSPDGTAVFFLHQDIFNRPNDVEVVVSRINSSKGQVLEAGGGDKLTAMNGYDGSGVVWARNNLVYLPGPNWKPGLLLTLRST